MPNEDIDVLTHLFGKPGEGYLAKHCPFCSYPPDSKGGTPLYHLRRDHGVRELVIR